MTAIITLALSMELEVIAEGVETRAQLEFVRALGCQATQGYVFSRPVSFDDCSALLSLGGFAEPSP